MAAGGAIEARLHHIDGLTEHFLYFNDDVFLGHPLGPGRFLESNGAARFFRSSTAVRRPRSARTTMLTSTQVVAVGDSWHERSRQRR